MFKKEAGFTLIEMLIVLMVISVLIILIIPNIGEKSGEVHSKGCEALISVVQAQVDTFLLETGQHPNSLDELVENDFITEDQLTCPNNNSLTYSNGKVNAS
ncbi:MULTISPECIES: competence type IV pilus major pilin ComGC [Oceanobacillus]|uniref:ComG operon protein 3 n=1 Tax=Oceanobacillus kimchii TaxID=746691 RepID=A0ABQ5TI63_9BACI|nr:MULTISPECIES: competence type IV pilus major pilin ComGC [Oceanobacillus]MBT2598338.1 prepilin-type N-terminal cleavage/methylation domain-containing protein [Oceanobacillus sp. ISL-74]MBT2651256.1 prepilin-type N-terminal cleavage/methylation domain-containing protein [Oceanobacillus sp. ISL-73]MCT1575915.1 prepilin-type N-terminal cleavage/methylation domain-containing protein [Oceanobacillus kimchii]MCT2135552.1 prepilin-type N-terminal cleavage/methylation domain-containing protein [Ocea